MELISNPDRSLWDGLCSRPADPNPVIRERVASIVGRVREEGDAAIRELAREIDGHASEDLKVSRERIEAAKLKVSNEVKKAISIAAKNIEKFHAAQLPREIEVVTSPGVRCIQRPVPINKVGLYIPGGTAPLFSTVLMLAIPARLAGCKEIILCTPSGKDGQIAPAVLYAADFCGVTSIFEIGGASAIAAMAYGTESVPKVDKIFGPGNQYVTTAKQMLSGSAVAIDMPAGPSEVMVIADDTTDAPFAASDLLSQAEHGRDSQVILVATSEAKALEIKAEVERQVALLSREELAKGALASSRLIVLKDENEIVAFADAYAPEHLIVSTAEPWKIASRVTAAGSVFVGKYTPESAGDYASGTNHTLPTCRWATSFSGVNIDSFIRKMTLQEITRDGLRELSATIIDMAEAEGLQAHANAVKVRIDD